MRESTNDKRGPEMDQYKKRKSVGVFISGFVVVWGLLSLLVHPLSRQASRAKLELFKGAVITPAVVDVCRHACINCHSEETRWPWYSHLAPVSWFVESDVKRARERMNLSRWDSLSIADQRVLLTAIGTVIENRGMPPFRYLVLHPEAKLSTDEVVEVIEWTRAERRRLRELSAMSPLK